MEIENEQKEWKTDKKWRKPNNILDDVVNKLDEITLIALNLHVYHRVVYDDNHQQLNDDHSVKLPWNLFVNLHEQMFQHYNHLKDPKIVPSDRSQPIQAEAAFLSWNEWEIHKWTTWWLTEGVIELLFLR